MVTVIAVAADSRGRLTASRMIENEWHHLRTILPHDNSLICSIPASQPDHKDKVKWGKLGRVSSLLLAEAGLHLRFAPLQALLRAHTLRLRRREEVSGGRGLTLTGSQGHMYSFVYPSLTPSLLCHVSRVKQIDYACVALCSSRHQALCRRRRVQWWLALCISIVYLMLPLFSSQYFTFVEVSFNISAYILFTYHALSQWDVYLFELVRSTWIFYLNVLFIIMKRVCISNGVAKILHSLREEERKVDDTLKVSVEQL